MVNYFNQKEVEALKDYFIKREMFYQLAIVAGIVFAFFIGLAI